jgi:hypothetical protein
MTFLQDLDPQAFPVVDGFPGCRLFLGGGQQPLEVLVAESGSRPTATDLRAAWKARVGGRATPVLLVVLHGDRAALCGPGGDPPPAFTDLDRGRVERICRAALGEPDRHAAERLLRTAIPDAEAPQAGLRNEGLFATHELTVGVRRRPDWPRALTRGRPLLLKRSRELLQALGYSIEPLPGPAVILRASKTKIAVAVLLERQEVPEVASARFAPLSPVAYALAKADEENLPFVVVLAGSVFRLYPAKTGVGVARRGRTETFVEVNLDLLGDEDAGYLDLLFSAEALLENGTFWNVLSTSGDFAADLGHRLRDRIYEEVIPPLAEAIIAARKGSTPSANELVLTYELVLTVLFRLLFVAYAEDKGLLPYRTSELYRARSLKQKARDLGTILDADTGFGPETTHWDDVVRLFRTVDQGSQEWGVPPYNGGLFATEATVSPAGAALEKIRLSNVVFGPILARLLLDETPEGRGPVDFRSLGVREFGTIYEGLLENELSVAEADLAIDTKGRYRPVGKKKADEIAVRRGQMYLHNASGARKASGSYFTKSFAVDHLLDHALDPALADHLTRLDAIKNDRQAADLFFDFRVADIAMGSGHFLVAAADRIERGLSGYLARRPLPDVLTELERLRTKARQALGSSGETVDIEDGQLLRRQIARRCIYGVDVNPLAVQLARLSLWIHTFVPGLPLSFLDHNLVEGNSLVGVATTDEAAEFLRDSAGSLFGLTTDALVGAAREAMSRLSRLCDADAAEIESARKAMGDARAAVRPAGALFDIVAAARIDEGVEQSVARNATRWTEDPTRLPGSPDHRRAREVLSATRSLHFPVAFPEVFLRERAGFDVMLGNPPWEEATLEEKRFWTRHDPGFHALSQPAQEARRKRLRRERPDLVQLYEKELAEASLVRRLLTSGPFPGMGTGDPDVYKAFVWRFWQLTTSPDGRIGVVLPRSALAAKGSREFRLTAFKEGVVEDLTILLNRAGWVFDDAEHRYTIALVSMRKSTPPDNATLPFRGPFVDRLEYETGRHHQPTRFLVRDVLGWTDTAALPLLPDETSAEVFAQLRKAPRLDLDDGQSWMARPYAELHATQDKKYMKLVADQPDGYWPVFTGESFDIWESDTGSYYAWADPDKMTRVLQEKRLRARTFDGLPQSWAKDPRTLPCWSARVAFRDVTNRTNRRTVIAALLPPRVFITNKAPYFLWPRGDERDQAYLLGVLCSIPLDWYARRFVEINLNYFILNPFPIPRPDRAHARWIRTVALAGRLAAADKRFARWAKAVGVECGGLDEDERQDMIHELDAVVANLYGLSEHQLRHVYETFHEGWDYASRLEGVLTHYRRWSQRR